MSPFNEVCDILGLHGDGYADLMLSPPREQLVITASGLLVSDSLVGEGLQPVGSERLICWKGHEDLGDLLRMECHIRCGLSRIGNSREGNQGCSFKVWILTQGSHCGW